MLLNRLLDAISWAANRRLRVIVNDENVKMTVYFNPTERVTPIQVLTALIDAIDRAKQDPANWKVGELKEREMTEEIVKLLSEPCNCRSTTKGTILWICDVCKHDAGCPVHNASPCSR